MFLMYQLFQLNVEKSPFQRTYAAQVYVSTQATTVCTSTVGIAQWTLGYNALQKLN